MINVIPVRVGFANNTLTKKSTVVVEGDYNTTKLVFEFEEDVTNKQIKFGMTNPRGELVMYCGLINNEIILSTEDIDGNVSSVFATDGLYTFRVFMLGEDGKSQLTSAPGYLPVDKSQVQAGMKAYGPFIDNLMKQVDTLDIELVEELDCSSIKITRKDGSVEVCRIPHAASEILKDNTDPVNSIAVIKYVDTLGVTRKAEYVYDIERHGFKELEYQGIPLFKVISYRSDSNSMGHNAYLDILIGIARTVTDTKEIFPLIQSPLFKCVGFDKYGHLDFADRYHNAHTLLTEVNLETWDYGYTTIEELFPEDFVDGENITQLTVNKKQSKTQKTEDGEILFHQIRIKVTGTEEAIDAVTADMEYLAEIIYMVYLKEEIIPDVPYIDCKYIGGNQDE